MRRWICLWMLLVLVEAGGKGRKNKRPKPSRAVLDRLSSTNLSGPFKLASPSASGLLPAPLDVAPHCSVEASATCGEGGDEDYCREMPGKRGIVCGICEGPEGAAARQHPPSHATDGDSDTWWQSPTLANGDEYKHVDFIIGLPDEMELLHVILKSGPSQRPLAWSLEVSGSEDSEDWRLVRAFGDKEHCRKIWDLRPERRRRKARFTRGVKKREDKPACSTQFTSPRPLENGEMHVALGEGMWARRVRISFRAPHPGPVERQFYTIRGITLAARCRCHGHADSCNVDTEGTVCVCMHGTCGSNCERCCEGGEWAPGEECTPGDHGDRGDQRDHCFNDASGVLCVNCTDNRAGPLCDKCLPGFYSQVSGGPCLPCHCDMDTSDGTCDFDRKLHQVTCNCREGATGPDCDVCAEGVCDVTTVKQCVCDHRGVKDTSHMCDEDLNCVCKDKVIGDHCDACPPGYFGPIGDVTEGCRPCYCSGVTDQCVVDNTRGETVYLPLGDAWNVTDENGEETLTPSLDDQGRPFLISYEVEDWSSIYWMSDVVEGVRAGYGGEVRAGGLWGVLRGDAGGAPTTQSDLILVADDGTRIAHGFRKYEVPGQFDLVIPLIENEWYTLTGDHTDRNNVSRQEFMNVLRDLKTIMLRAHFHTDQDEVRLESVVVEGGPPGSRERCLCPAGYVGPGCSRCGPHHLRLSRAPHSVPAFECVPCPCNGHATCLTLEGPCGPCEHNTTGPHCERCLPGHYGNPVLGGCKPCACPLYIPSNNFSPNCALSSAVGDEFVCTQCPEGYAGDRCETCEAGYWGSPTVPGGSCVECECGGAPCHPGHGGCLQCPPHAEGAACDQCEEGYWFGPGGYSGAGSTCVPCGCGTGALTAGCSSSGQCACRAGYTGTTCQDCREGHAVPGLGCPVCECGTGAESRPCDPVSGACVCRDGAASPTCDTCLPGHYNLTRDGCKGCNCSSLGSESGVCDIRTGQCRCKSHVTGRACDICEEGYWGLQLGGCRRCQCGAGSPTCDPYSGRCACGPGVGGDHCDTCLQGFYNYGPHGCLECPKCSEGRVCESGTGRCVCPTGSRGPHCDTCVPGYYGPPPRCKPCKCGPGAVNSVCDVSTGECVCRSGWSGRRCERCAEGHFGPRCRPCGCLLAGTHCSGGLCVCDEHGRCPCKTNVIGDKCDTCADGTFGLSAGNPDGCTACFCFGRSAKCTQAGLARGKLHAHRHTHVTLRQGDMEPEMDRESLLAIHTNSTDVVLGVGRPEVPVYVALEDPFLGDRLSSYGGDLSFTVEEEGGEPLPAPVREHFPLVRIYGRDNVVLDYFERKGSVNGTYTVRFHESLWRWGARDQGGLAVASRGALMVALQHLTAVLVRVSTRTPTYDNVHSLLLNVSMDTAIPGSSRSTPALGVEMCECPVGYASGSCQEPAIGFYMPHQRTRIDNVQGTIVISLEGEVKSCKCNGRADRCHAVTGKCLDCRYGTGGPQCEICAEGHYGSPESPRGCQPCPCPERTRNFADSCHFYGDTLRCLCKPGYAGEECEECADGYVRSIDGGCVPCGCHPLGSVSEHCDEHGRCRCSPYATGKKCDQCIAPRTILEPEGCIACDNCTQTLLDFIESLSQYLTDNMDINELSRLPAPYPALQQFADRTSDLRNQFYLLTNDIHSNRDYQPEVEILVDKVGKLRSALDRLKDESIQRDNEAYSLSLESMKALEDVLNERKKIGELVGVLDDFARGERHMTAHKALKEARHLLRSIKNIGVIESLAGASDVFDTATVQSTSVQEYAYKIEDVDQRLKKMKKALEDWQIKADDIVRLTDKVWDAGDTVNALTKSTKPRIAAIRDIGLRCRLLLEDITSLAPENVENSTQEAINRIEELSARFPQLTEELQANIATAEEKEGILYELTPKYREKYLKAAEKHVAELGEKAKIYKSLFAGTLKSAAGGVSAARAWSDVVEGVRGAGRAVEGARAAVGGVAGGRGVQGAALRARGDSLTQIRRGEELINQTKELNNVVDQLERASGRVRVEVRGLGWGERGLGSRPRVGAGARGALQAAVAHADRLELTTRALYDEASEIRRRIRYQLRRRLTELQKDGDTALGAAQEYVSQIRSNTVRCEEVAGALTTAAAARGREHTSADLALRPASLRLRHLVQSARHAADTIAVSLTSGPAPAGCSRAYSLSTSGAAVTRLSFTISFDKVRDGPIVYLGDHNGYMQIIVQGSKLKAIWNLGDGEAVIVHQQKLEPVHDDVDHTTYKVELERVWGTVRLTVELGHGSHSITATNSSRGSHVSLRPRRLWLGAPNHSLGLSGCIHSLYLDDRRIGLWNFVHQPEEAQCAGCTQRYWHSTRSGEASLAWFNGEGYSELRRSSRRPYDRRHFSVSFTFRTRDHDALLLMVLDKAQNRSLSVWVRSCKVVLVVEYGGPRLELEARGRHCSGRPTHVQAIRLFHNQLEKGSLRVNGEETLGSPSPPVLSAALLPDLSDSPYWVGGLPPGPSPSPSPSQRPSPSPSPRGLLGCLGALTVDRQGYDPLDTPTRHGVEPNCGNRSLRSATLEGTGYIELPSPLFRRKAALGISFRARAPNGLIMYRTPSLKSDDNDDGDSQHYLIVELKDGEIHVRIAAGKNELNLRSNGTKYDDGILHTLRLVRAHKQMEVWCDESLISRGELAGGALKGRDTGLYVGGTVPRPEGGGQLQGGFTGTLADLVLDGVVIGFETAVTWTDAQLGRTDDETAPEPHTEAHPLQAPPTPTNLCAKPPWFAVVGGAVKVGDGGHGGHGGHSVVVARRPPAPAPLSLSLLIRTYRPTGLLLLVPGSRAKSRHYLALMLRDGLLRLIVRGRKKKEISLTAPVADGTWKSVSVRVSNNRMVLASGGVASTAKAPRKVGLGARVYIGGLPDRRAIPHIPESVVQMGGVVGCIRRVVVSGREEDLVRGPHRGLRQCFPDVEPAAYFTGESWALWNSSWSGGGEGAAGEAGGARGARGEVRVVARTSHGGGVLLATEHYILQLNNGMVELISRDGVLVRSVGGVVCDGAWHEVGVTVGGGGVSLRVDSHTGEGRGRGGGQGEGPLYIGAAPESIGDKFSDTKEPFKGCIREVTVDGVRKDWTEMETLHNVLLDSCPVNTT